jgi:hypothetical protein
LETRGKAQRSGDEAMPLLLMEIWRRRDLEDGAIIATVRSHSTQAKDAKQRNTAAAHCEVILLYF